jgi:hypothetical protein
MACYSYARGYGLNEQHVEGVMARCIDLVVEVRATRFVLPFVCHSNPSNMKHIMGIINGIISWLLTQDGV